jgi:hypothetical protein
VDFSACWDKMVISLIFSQFCFLQSFN